MIPAAMVAAAQYVADRLGPGQGNRSVRDAVIAWWAAEHGYRWPPNSLNNPGFMRPPGQEGFASGTGTVSGAPGVFLRFGDAGHGVDAFVDRVATSGHYGGIRAAIRAVASGSTSAVAIANAVGASPWGTNGITMRAALAYVQRIVGATPAADWRSAGSSGADASLVAYTGGTTYTADQWNAFIACCHDKGVTRLIGPGNAALVTACAASNGISLAAVNLSDYYGKSLSDLRDGLAAKGVIPKADAFNFVPDIAGAIGTLGDAIRQAVVLLAILVVVILGLYTLTRSGEAPA